jgi:hypothetical protein
MSSGSDLPSFVSDVERIRHCSPDLFEDLISSRISSVSFLCSSNFGPNNHSFLTTRYSQRQLTLSHSDLDDDVTRISTLSPDIQDYVACVMFSSCSAQFPSRYIERSVHDHLLVRSRSPSQTPSSSGNSQREKPPLNTGQTLGLALSSKILFGRKSIPSFTVLFPGTSKPRVQLILGHPTIEKDLFNTLLLSKLRALKTAIRAAGHPCPKRLPSPVVAAMSRMIHRSLIALHFDSSQSVKKSKPKTSSRTYTSAPVVVKEFVRASNPIDEPSPPADPDPPETVACRPSSPTELPDTTTHAPINDIVVIEPSIGPDPWSDFTSFANAMCHITPEDCRALRTLHDRIYNQKILDPDSIALLRLHGMPFLMRIFDWLGGPTAGLGAIAGPMVAFSRLSKFLSTLDYGQLIYDQMSIPCRYPPIVDHISTHELLTFYRDYRLQNEPKFDELLMQCEIFVMCARSM